MIYYPFTIYPLVNGYDENTDARVRRKKCFSSNWNNDGPVYRRKFWNLFAAFMKKKKT